MRVGIIVPQGWTGEFDGWEPRRAWARAVEIARRAERLGFQSLWVFDHFHTVPRPTPEITFESFSVLAALAPQTDRVRLGHIVLCAAFRNPALTAKMIATLDSVSGGRMELGIGAGWKRDEWLAYGYGFPGTAERLAILRDQLEVITRMFAGGPGDQATFDGQHAHVERAYNVPKPIQPHLPVMVGGNGPNVTWRIAARFADELNLDGLAPAEVAAAMPTIRSRCDELGRDPATLAVSAHIGWSAVREEGARRVELLAGYREIGVSRIIALVRASVGSDEALESFAADCRAAGATLAG